jgi:hypothetical protein
MTLVVVAVLGFWMASRASAEISDCIDATCKISATDGSRGTGCVFERSQGQVFVLTAAHVVGSERTIGCEFWHAGHQSAPLPGRVLFVSQSADAAIVVISESAFAGVLPKVIPIAERTCVLRPGQTVTSVGCANGSWSTGWKGHVIGYRGADLHFVPTPANGRSGSAIFDAQGEKIVGLLRARTSDDSQGIATSVQSLYAAFEKNTTEKNTTEQNTTRDTRDAWHPASDRSLAAMQSASPPTQCPGGICPLPNWSADRLLPYRQEQERRLEQIQQQPSPVYPTLPSAASSAEMSQISLKLDRVIDLLGDMKEDRGAVAGGSAVVPVQPTVVDDEAREAAEAAAVQAATEEALGEVKDETRVLRELAEQLIGDRETLKERFEARIAKVKDELGEDTSRREIAKAYLKDLAAEKLSDGSLGLTAGAGREDCLLLALLSEGLPAAQQRLERCPELSRSLSGWFAGLDLPCSGGPIALGRASPVGKRTQRRLGDRAVGRHDGSADLVSHAQPGPARRGRKQYAVERRDHRHSARGGFRGRRLPCNGLAGDDRMTAPGQPVPILFIWGPKVAGTSIWSALQSTGWSYQDLHNNPKQFRRETTVTTFGHCTVPALVEAGLIDSDDLARRFKFAFVRNPWDRLVSLFHYLRWLSDPRSTSRPGSAEFRRFVEAATVDDVPTAGAYNVRGLSQANSQLDWLRESDGQFVPDFVGRYERLQDDWQTVCRQIGITVALPHLNRSVRNHYRDYYDDQLRERVAERFAEEIDLLKYDF